MTIREFIAVKVIKRKLKVEYMIDGIFYKHEADIPEIVKDKMVTDVLYLGDKTIFIRTLKQKFIWRKFL